MNNLNSLILIMTLSLFVLCYSLKGQGGQKNLGDPKAHLHWNNEQERVDRKSFNVPQMLFAGIVIDRKEHKQTIFIPPVFEFFPFNTVEGFATNLSFSFTQNLSGEEFIKLKPALRYGFGNGHLNGKLSVLHYYNADLKALLDISGGRFVEQVNKESNLNAFNNTIYTLRGSNFLKLYERNYIEMAHSFSPMDDFILSGKIVLEERFPLKNLDRFDSVQEGYSSNDPLNQELSNTQFSNQANFQWEIGLSWQYEHNYIRKRGQLVSNSNYPEITVKYITATKDVLGSDLSFQKWMAQLKDNYSSKVLGSGKVLLEIGDFVSKTRLTFVDFKHFNGQRAAFASFQMGDFRLLDYYLRSTARFYFQGHWEHQFNRVSKTRFFRPVFSLNYLSTKETPSYLELGIGVMRLYKNFRIDLVNSWDSGKHGRFGVRVGYIIQ